MILTQKKKIYDVLKKTPLAVISTIDMSQDRPESALVAFSQNRELELFFMTFVDSRKYPNLQSNPTTSLVIGFEYLTLQYEGIAKELTSPSHKEALDAFKHKETPCAPDFLNNPRARFFKVVPRWIRYSDYTSCPAKIFEYTPC